MIVTLLLCSFAISITSVQALTLYLESGYKFEQSLNFSQNNNQVHEQKSVLYEEKRDIQPPCYSTLY